MNKVCAKSVEIAQVKWNYYFLCVLCLFIGLLFRERTMQKVVTRIVLGHKSAERFEEVVNKHLDEGWLLESIDIEKIGFFRRLLIASLTKVEVVE